MIVVSENLNGVVRQFDLCEPGLVEEFSIQIKLGSKIRRMKECKDTDPIIYGSPFDVEQYFDQESEFGRDLYLAPGESVLASSDDNYKMPIDYFGLLQTKGSLARLFVAITCNDGQIEPGYEGLITLEITNHARYSVKIPFKSPIGQLYILRCASPASKPYAGRYQNAKGPTVAHFG